VIAQLECRKNNIVLSREAINLLIEKSNSDRNNLRNEIEKIKSKKIRKVKNVNTTTTLSDISEQENL